jgi:hypothetical protein
MNRIYFLALWFFVSLVGNLSFGMHTDSLKRIRRIGIIEGNYCSGIGTADLSYSKMNNYPLYG